MNEVKDELKIKEKINEEKNGGKKKFTIFGFTITKLLAYFIIYSVIGFVIYLQTYNHIILGFLPLK